MSRHQISDTPPIAATPMAFVRSMTMGAHRLGHDPSAALLAARISDEMLGVQDGRITSVQMESLSDQLMQELDDEALGWFSRRLPWGSYGMLARASITSPTLRVALQRWCRHHGLLTDDVVLTLSDSNATVATLTVIEKAPRAWLHGEMREFCHVSLLRNLLGLASWLVDSRIPLKSINLAYNRPIHAIAYNTLFACPASFDHSHTQVHFDASYLGLPLRRNEEMLRQMLKHALPLTVHRYRKDRLLVDRARQVMAMRQDALRSAEALAAHLNLSERTLYRQLKADGYRLQDLKDSVRQEIAIRTLLNKHQPLKKTALAAGFDSDKSFIRAFKRWTGQTPAEFSRNRPPN